MFIVFGVWHGSSLMLTAPVDRGTAGCIRRVRSYTWSWDVGTRAGNRVPHRQQPRRPHGHQSDLEHGFKGMTGHHMGGF